MAVSTLEARGRILDDLGAAADEAGLAVACLGEAYEQLDPDTADRLEDDLFRPLQKAYGRAKRARSGFAARFGLVVPASDAPVADPDARSVKALVDRAVAAAGMADHKLGELQDSMLPIEAGDAELRASLAEVRDLLGGVSGPAREITRRLGR